MLACILAELRVTGTFVPSRGDRIAGRYELEEQLRGTGVARVFRARVLNPTGKCALMLFDAARCSPGAWASFVRVASAAAEARIPGLVALTGLPPTPTAPLYCVTEIPDGRGLDAIRKENGLLNWKRALSLGVWFAEILDSAYRATGVAHRALTPSRCIVGPGDVVSVLDFGLAELEAAGGGPSDGLYRAPEQQRGGGDVRSDVYSLAAILYESIMGERPSQWAVPPLRSKLKDKDVTDEVEALFAKALAREPRRRFPDLAAMASVMQKLSGASPRAIASTQPAPLSLSPVEAPASAILNPGPLRDAPPVEGAFSRTPESDVTARILPSPPPSRPEPPPGEVTERLPIQHAREPSPPSLIPRAEERPVHATLALPRPTPEDDSDQAKTTTFVRPPRFQAPSEPTEKLPQRTIQSDRFADRAARQPPPQRETDFDEAKTTMFARPLPFPAPSEPTEKVLQPAIAHPRPVERAPNPPAAPWPEARLPPPIEPTVCIRGTPADQETLVLSQGEADGGGLVETTPAAGKPAETVPVDAARRSQHSSRAHPKVVILIVVNLIFGLIVLLGLLVLLTRG